MNVVPFSNISNFPSQFCLQNPEFCSGKVPVIFALSRNRSSWDLGGGKVSLKKDTGERSLIGTWHDEIVKEQTRKIRFLEDDGDVQ